VCGFCLLAFLPNGFLCFFAFALNINYLPTQVYCAYVCVCVCDNYYFLSFSYHERP
jgi:hypothetical protein